MKKVLVLTPPDARYGFNLTGVEQRVTAPGELSKTLLDASRDSGTGVIVVDERLIDDEARALLAALERTWPGVIVVLPRPESTAAGEEDYALELIRRAIGYQVRLST